MSGLVASLLSTWEDKVGSYSLQVPSVGDGEGASPPASALPLESDQCHRLVPWGGAQREMEKIYPHLARATPAWSPWWGLQRTLQDGFGAVVLHHALRETCLWGGHYNHRPSPGLLLLAQDQSGWWTADLAHQPCKTLSSWVEKGKTCGRAALETATITQATTFPEFPVFSQANWLFRQSSFVKTSIYNILRRLLVCGGSS